jgi:hypothetical protein
MTARVTGPPACRIEAKLSTVPRMPLFSRLRQVSHARAAISAELTKIRTVRSTP